MLDAALYKEDIFAVDELINSINAEDILLRLGTLRAENAVLSVVKGKD